ncbi:MAG: ATP-binding cassette domain-containing protein [Nitrospira sp.]|nr:ATP-binding cassette domain-containing protein [Nitrospira sp.]
MRSEELPTPKGINLEIQRSELVTIVGASGAGKSTLAGSWSFIPPGIRCVSRACGEPDTSLPPQANAHDLVQATPPGVRLRTQRQAPPHDGTFHSQR